jgi:hypothetical protein
MTQRHHLVPRFYINGWSMPGQGLLALRRSTGEALERSAKTVAYETDAYAIDVPYEGKNYTVEKMLSSVESAAAKALRNMLASWPPSDEDRGSWSLLMALQVTRGRDFRDNMNAVQEHLLKTMVALSPRDDASMRKRLDDAGLEASEENLTLLREMMDDPGSYRVKMHPAHLLSQAMKTGVEMLPYLAGRTWNLGVLDEPLLITTDHPLTLHSAAESLGPFGAIGLMTADEIWMPLDPTRILVMTHPDTEARVAKVPLELVPSINFGIASECYEWVVTRRDHPRPDILAEFIKGQPPPGIEIGGPSLDALAAAGRRLSENRGG